MKNALRLLFLFSAITGFSQKDYLLQINDTTVEVSLDEILKLNVDGKSLEIKLSAKDTLVYDSDLVSFKYSSDYKISKLDLDEGIS